MNTMKFRLGEMFCGPGGMALGAKLARAIGRDKNFQIEHQWALDIDRDSCETYAKNICPEQPQKVICTDVKNLDITKLETIDGFAFGFPCNDFSIVGEQRGIEGRFGSLYTYGVKVLNYFRPLWFIAENVSGLSSANEGKTFGKILTELQKCANGYKLTTHLYRFEFYGVPQTRHRIIIVGIRSDLGLEFKIPAPTHPIPISARFALENPPIPASAKNQELTRQSPTVIERLQYIRPGENAWNATIPDRLKLKVKGAKISQIYKRLDPDKPAYTITGSGGGGTHGYHWQENRALTNRERARLQTFPDDFVFYGSKESVRKQIGMAVPPEGARVIFEALLKTFAGIGYASITPTWRDETIDEVQLTLSLQYPLEK